MKASCAETGIILQQFLTLIEIMISQIKGLCDGASC